MIEVPCQEYKRWLIAGISAFTSIILFMVFFLRIGPEISLQQAPFMILDYINLPPPPKMIPEVPPKQKPPPKAEKKIPDPEPPPTVKAPIEVSEPSSAPSEFVTAPKAEKPKPSVAEDIRQLDNAEFSPIYNPKPRYPDIARAAGIEGFVVVDLLIDETGRVKSFSILKTEGHQQFTLETSKVIRSWRFPPPRIGGKLSMVRYEYKVVFRLE
ncbi:MAG: energy transducer TonB [bacterium]